MSLQKGYHHAYDTHYHIVFPVKYRKSLLDNHITEAILDISKQIQERYDITFESVGCDQNHIHILCSFPPTKSGGDVVRIFKSITAKQLFLRYPELRKELWGGEFWSDGYYITTVSEYNNWSVVEKYVTNQGKTNDEPLRRRLFT